MLSYTITWEDTHGDEHTVIREGAPAGNYLSALPAASSSERS